MSKFRCSVCGSTRIMAKINGKYYCFECGAKIVNKHVKKLIEDLSKKGLIEN